MSIQIDAAILARRIAVLDQIGVGPLWLRRDAVIEGMPIAPVATPVLAPAPAPIAPPLPASKSAPVMPAAASASIRGADDAAWDDGAMHSMTAAPVKTVLALCTSADVDDAARYLFIARASSVQGSEELFDNIIRALGLQKEAGAQCDLAQLAAQIATHRPSVLIAMGPAAALQLIDPSRTAEDRTAADDHARFEALRGRLHRVDALPLLVTYEATHLLRHPADKRKAWDDLCLLQQWQAGDVVDPA